MLQELRKSKLHRFYFVQKAKDFFFKKNTVFAGLSDFHKLVLSVFITTFPKSKPKEINYRNFKNYSEENLNQDFSADLREKCFKNLCIF